MEKLQGFAVMKKCSVRLYCDGKSFHFNHFKDSLDSLEMKLTGRFSYSAVVPYKIFTLKAKPIIMSSTVMTPDFYQYQIITLFPFQAGGYVAFLHSDAAQAGWKHGDARCRSDCRSRETSGHNDAPPSRDPPLLLVISALFALSLGQRCENLN